MLLFKPEHIYPILEGRKTETRRQWDRWRVNLGSTQQAKTVMISREFFALLEIMDRYEQTLGEISPGSIHAEGYNSLDQYRQVWEKINKRPWDDSEEVKVVEFRVVDIGSAYLAFVERF